MKKLFAMLLVFCLMTGCSAQPQETSAAPAQPQDTAVAPVEVSYPEIPAAALDYMTYATQENQDIRVSYPLDMLTPDTEVYPMTFYLNDSLETDFFANINIQKSIEFPGVLDESALEEFMEAFGAQYAASGMTITLSELRTLHGQPVIYLEAVTQITDTVIDIMIEQGILTEEYIESIGGRDILKALPPTYNTGIYGVVDSHIAMYTASYQDEAHRQPLIDVMTVLFSNTEILG